MKIVVFFLSIIPKNLLSYITGYFVRIAFPGKMAFYVNKTLAALFKINMTEAEKPLSDYKTFEDVFTRKLKEGARPLDKSPYCSPCDGTLSLTQELTDPTKTLQVKGSTYSLFELIFGKNHSKNLKFKPCWVSTFYLAPHNYHRVHSPISGFLRSIKHIPGTLWPVNPLFLSYIPRLFSRNERLVFEIETAEKGLAYLVMVGAFNVGRITSPLSKGIISNNKIMNTRGKTEILTPPVELTKGQEIGTFMLGSTVVLAFDKNIMTTFPSKPRYCLSKETVKMGKNLLVA